MTEAPFLKPLKKGHIRLLHVDIPEDGRPATYKIDRHRLNLLTPKYVAVSHEWKRRGQSDTVSPSRDTIHLGYGKAGDTIAVPVSADLALALKLACRKWASLKDHAKMGRLRLWIDTLCIAQNDQDEKSRQVPMMTEVYARAQAVFAVVGVHGVQQKGKPVFDFFRDLRTLLSTHSSTEIRDFLYEPAKCRQVLRACPQLWPGYNESSLSVWKGIQDLLRSSFWSRAWILQEISAPARIIFFWGHICFFDGDLMALIILLGVLTKSPDFTKHVDVNYEHLLDYFVLSVSRFGTMKREMDVLSLLHTMRQCYCSNDLDRVYSIAGLVNDVKVHPDYTVRVQDLFVAFAESIYEHHPRGMQHLLSWAGPKADDEAIQPEASIHSSLTAGTFELPSWVPDWRHCHAPEPLTARKPKGFYAAGQIHHDGRPEVDVSKDNVLSLGGFQIARITGITTVCTKRDHTSLARILRSWRESVARKQHKVPPGELNAMFQRLIVADVSSEKRKTKNGRDYLRGATVDLSVLDEDFQRQDDGRFVQRCRLLERLSVCYMRRICFANNALMGLVPAEAAIDDLVCLIPDFDPVYILRSRPPDCEISGARFVEYVGEAYVDGIMDGEAWDKFNLQENDIKQFHIK